MRPVRNCCFRSAQRSAPLRAHPIRGPGPIAPCSLRRAVVVNEQNAERAEMVNTYSKPRGHRRCVGQTQTATLEELLTGYKN